MLKLKLKCQIILHQSLCFLQLSQGLSLWTLLGNSHTGHPPNLALLTSCGLRPCLSRIIILLLWSAIDVGKVYIGKSTNDTQRLYAFSSNIPSSSWSVPVYLHRGTAGTVCIAFCIILCFISLYFFCLCRIVITIVTAEGGAVYFALIMSWSCLSRIILFSAHIRCDRLILSLSLHKLDFW